MGNQAKKGKNSVTAVVILLAIVYISFLLYQSVYFNFQRSQKIKKYKKDIVVLQDKQKKIESLIAYYKTDSFQELEARRKLGLKLPGEKVVTVEVKEQKNEASKIDDAPDAVSGRNQSNLELWREFISGEQNRI